MFSRRSGFPRQINRCSRLLAERRAAGAELLDLTESNPTRAGFRSLDAAPIEALVQAECRRYEPAAAGRRQAREAVARYYAERGVAVDPARILLGASTSEAYSWLLKLLADPGDSVLLPEPGYPLVDYLAALEGVELRRYRLDAGADFALDFPALEQAIAARSRAVLLVSPNNPTGSVVSREELAALDALGARRGLAVVCDEVFADFPHAEEMPVPVAGALAHDALTFTLSGISKVCGLPQLKLGWILVGGPPALVEEALGRLEVIADTFLSVGTPVQVALPRLLAARHDFLAECGARIRASREWIARRLRAEPAVRMLPAAAGWYAVLRVPSLRGEEELVLELLERDGVVVQPGYFFDFPGEAYLVVSLLTPPATLAVGLERVLARLGEPGAQGPG